VNATHDTIAEYVRRMERHLVGSKADREGARAELEELLADAAEAGEFEATLDSLGSPDEAARAFTRGRERTAASMADRLMAAAVDNLPLIALAVALFVRGIANGRATFTFPPFAYVEVAGGCAALVPPCGVYNGGTLYAVGLPLALLWSIVALGLLESWTGATPGKRLLGLRVVTEDGIRIRPYAGMVRRMSFLAGPIAWLDWIPALWGERQRILDRVAATRVIRVRAEEGT